MTYRCQSIYKGDRKGMKKVFSFVIAVAVIAIALGVSVGTASAAGSSVVLYLPGVTQQDLKGAFVLVNSENHDVQCVLKDAETGKVVCHVPGKYAGQDVVLFVAGQVFGATVPQPNTPNGIEEPTYPANGNPYDHWPNSAYDYCDAGWLDMALQLYYQTVSPNNWIAGAPGQTPPSGYNAHSMLPNYPTACDDFYSQGHADTRP
jgi:hypothetical protein